MKKIITLGCFLILISFYIIFNKIYSRVELINLTKEKVNIKLYAGVDVVYSGEILGGGDEIFYFNPNNDGELRLVSIEDSEVKIDKKFGYISKNSGIKYMIKIDDNGGIEYGIDN